MSRVFMWIFNASISASYLVLAVLIARLVLKNAPKWIHVLLWAVVGLRLTCPFTLESALSLIPSAHTLPQNITLSPAPAIDSGFPAINDAVNPALQTFAAPQVGASVNPMQIYLSIAAWVWMMGFTTMLLYTIISYLRLEIKLDTAIRYRDNIFQSEYVDSPFVLGLFHPRIYLPYFLDESTMICVIAHEQAHIRRRDNWWKPIGFFLLSIHWFNPVMWISYSLLCRDIELACDEKVIRNLTCRQRADYSQALLDCSLHRKPISACPLAFGEVGIKDRIQSILHYRKPAIWLLPVSLVVCAGLALCFLTDPKEKSESVTESTPSESETAVPTTESHEISLQATQLSDLAYYLELAFPGKTFQSMDAAAENAMLSEYQDHLDGYLTLARQSTDGTDSYILGLYGEIELTTGESPLYGSLTNYIYQLPDGRFLHYPPPETADAQRELEEFVASMALSATAPTVLPEGYWITQYILTVINQGRLILITPPDNTCNFGQIAANYLTSAQGKTYIADAVARGVCLTQPKTPYLQVFLVHPIFGETCEFLPLTEDLVQTILSQSKEALPAGHGFSATLHIDSGQEWFSEQTGVPLIVQDLAVAQCGYTFATPADITGTIIEARFDCPWLDQPCYAKQEDLPKLEQILKNAEFGYMGSCGYGAFLHLKLSDGKELTVVKGTDTCDSIAFGSYGGYFLGDANNTLFWNLFGLDETTHLSLE